MQAWYPERQYETIHCYNADSNWEAVLSLIFEACEFFPLFSAANCQLTCSNSSGSTDCAVEPPAVKLHPEADISSSSTLPSSLITVNVSISINMIFTAIITSTADNDMPGVATAAGAGP